MTYYIEVYDDMGNSFRVADSPVDGDTPNNCIHLTGGDGDIYRIDEVDAVVGGVEYLIKGASPGGRLNSIVLIPSLRGPEARGIQG